MRTRRAQASFEYISLLVAAISIVALVSLLLFTGVLGPSKDKISSDACKLCAQHVLLDKECYDSQGAWNAVSFPSYAKAGDCAPRNAQQLVICGDNTNMTAKSNGSLSCS